MKLIISIVLILFSEFIYAQDVFSGLTIFTPKTGGGPIGNGRDITTYLIDNNNNIVHTWAHERGVSSMPYLLPDSSIIYPYRVPNPTMISGGVGGGIQHISWNGDILWNYQVSNEDYQHHHDIQPLPNGNILIIAWERKTSEEAYEMGRDTISNPIDQCWSEAIFEYDPNLDANVWEWHLWDHLIQDVDSELQGFGNVSAHPELFDINKGNIGGSGGPEGEANGDWMHFNAIAYNIELDQIIISSRHQCEIYIIDHSTTTEEAAGHIGGIYGKGGDFLYRWGNPQNYNRGTDVDKQLMSQHGANWIDPDLPGEGNILLFNNYYTENLSAVFELNPPYDELGNYFINDGESYGPEIPSWIHTGVFFSEVQSGAFRLPNGNTLITDANTSRIFEVTIDGEIVWDYIHSGVNLIARAQKYGYDYFESYELGDVNMDENIDVMDVVLTANIILNLYNPSLYADLNQDGIINIYDIIILVNLIINN